jgi:hypothetical protein
MIWQDLEFGVIMHFSTNTFPDREWGDGSASSATFNPTQFDPDQWMRAIRERYSNGAPFITLRRLWSPASQAGRQGAVHAASISIEKTCIAKYAPHLLW